MAEARRQANTFLNKGKVLQESYVRLEEFDDMEETTAFT